MESPAFVGKNVLVTGAGSGIGRQISLDLASMGAFIFLLDINKDGLCETAKLCKSEKIKIINADLCELGTLEDILIAALEGERLDGLVHCAGVSQLSPLKSLDMDRALKTYLINGHAAIYLSKFCSSYRVISKLGALFVFISSIYGQVGSAANSAYAMSKSAITGLVKSLAIELAPKKIRVNSIVPGFIETSMLDKLSENFDAEYVDRLRALHPLGLGGVSDVSNAIIFLLSQKSSWITGSELVVDGGYTAQ